MRSLYPRYHCADGTSLTIHAANGKLFDPHDKEWDRNDLVTITCINEHAISVCDGWNANDRHDLSNVYSVRASVVVDMMLQHGGCIMTVTEDTIAEMLDVKHKELALYACEKMKKTTAEVYIKPLSKLQRERARACDDVVESHFFSIKYPEYGTTPHAWRYSASEIWIERPWLDKMISNHGELKIFRYISKHTNASSDEEPLLNYDKRIKIPVYRINMDLLRDFNSDVYPRELVDKIIDKMNGSVPGNQPYYYVLEEAEETSDSIHVTDISFNTQFPLLDNEPTITAS